MKKSYIEPKAIIVECELEKMISESKMLMWGGKASSAGITSSDANDRYDYEEDDEDLW